MTCKSGDEAVRTSWQPPLLMLGAQLSSSPGEAMMGVHREGPHMGQEGPCCACRLPLSRVTSDISCNAWEKPWKTSSPCFPAVFPIAMFTSLPTNGSEELGRSSSPTYFPSVFPIAIFTGLRTSGPEELAFQGLATPGHPQILPKQEIL